MYAVVTSVQDVWQHFDAITKLMRGMIRRTGSHGQSAETVMNLMLNYAESPLGFNLLKFSDETGVLEGVLFAIGIKTSTEIWIEIVALSAPKVAMKARAEAFDMLSTWAKSLGATKLLAVLTRSPERFYRFFYEGIGFEKVGTLIERRL